MVTVQRWRPGLSFSFQFCMPASMETRAMTENKSTRRRSLLKGAAVAAGAMSAPMVSMAQTTSFRFQSTWPAKDIFHEFAQDFAKKVNDMAGNRLKIEVLPSGAV